MRGAALFAPKNGPPRNPDAHAGLKRVQAKRMLAVTCASQRFDKQMELIDVLAPLPVCEACWSFHTGVEHTPIRPEPRLPKW